MRGCAAPLSITFAHGCNVEVPKCATGPEWRGIRRLTGHGPEVELNLRARRGSKCRRWPAADGTADWKKTWSPRTRKRDWSAWPCRSQSLEFPVSNSMAPRTARRPSDPDGGFRENPGRLRDSKPRTGSLYGNGRSLSGNPSQLARKPPRPATRSRASANKSIPDASSRRARPQRAVSFREFHLAAPEGNGRPITLRARLHGPHIVRAPSPPAPALCRPCPPPSNPPSGGARPEARPRSSRSISRPAERTLRAASFRMDHCNKPRHSHTISLCRRSWPVVSLPRRAPSRTTHARPSCMR